YFVVISLREMGYRRCQLAEVPSQAVPSRAEVIAEGETSGRESCRAIRCSVLKGTHIASSRGARRLLCSHLAPRDGLSAWQPTEVPSQAMPSRAEVIAEGETSGKSSCRAIRCSVLKGTHIPSSRGARRLLCSHLAPRDGLSALPPTEVPSQAMPSRAEVI